MRKTWVLALVVVACAACGTAKQEAASLAIAVERYRKAPMDDKGATAAMLEQLACSDAEVCAAKEACLASSRATVHGMALKREVEVALDELDAGRLTLEQVSRAGLPSKLDEASRAVEEGRGRLSACDEKVIALRLKYAL